MTGYVEELREELFSLTKSEIDDLLKSTSAKYKPPASLSSPFTDRVTKEQAVERYRQQQDREATKLHPVGKINKEILLHKDRCMLLKN